VRRRKRRAAAANARSTALWPVTGGTLRPTTSRVPPSSRTSTTRARRYNWTATPRVSNPPPRLATDPGTITSRAAAAGSRTAIPRDVLSSPSGTGRGWAAALKCHETKTIPRDLTLRPSTPRDEGGPVAIPGAARRSPRCWSWRPKAKRSAVPVHWYSCQSLLARRRLRPPTMWRRPASCSVSWPGSAGRGVSRGKP
jgi:hypothetical protein